MRRPLQFGACLLLVFATAVSAGAAEKFKHIAVMPFENTTRDKTLDWVGGGIAEVLTTDLAKFQDFTLVERGRLNDALKEIKLGQSGAVDPATAQKMGKILGADSIVVGSFQRFQDDMRIFARVIDVQTAEVRVSTRVDGAYKNLLNLQSDIAAKLVEEMKGSLAAVEKKKLETLPSKNLDAVQALSDGAFFLRSDLIQDAVKEFDRAIALDPNFVEAHYYRGVAMAKLMQWDEAIASLKRTLPRAQTEQKVKWSWDAPFEGQGTQRGLFLGRDSSGLSTEGPSTEEERILAQKRLAYAERLGKSTVLHFVDLERKSSSRVEIPDDQIPIATIGVEASDSLTVIPVITPAMLQAGTIGLYGVSTQGVLWHTELKDKPGLPMPIYFIRGGILLEVDASGPVIAYDIAGSLQRRWERADFQADRGNIIVKGGLALLTSIRDRKIHGVRLSDGTDAWTLDYAAHESLQLATDKSLIVFEPDRGVFAVDIATGKTFARVDEAPLAVPGPRIFGFSVPALVQDNILYFVSKAEQLVAVDLNPSTAGPRRILWKTALKTRVESIRVNGGQVYAGGLTGEFVIVDRTSGAVRVSKKISAGRVTIAAAENDVVFGNTVGRIFAFEPRTGSKLWESVNATPSPLYHKGLILLRPSATQLALVDAVTGGTIWQYAGTPFAVWHSESSVYVLEANGVREYALDRSAIQGITNKEAMTELAHVLVSKGTLDEASRFAERVSRESDPNYPPLRLVQSRIDQGRGNIEGARKELATYADLVGRQSKAGLEIIDSLKSKDGLVWATEISAPLGVSDIVDGKILSGNQNEIAVLDAATGKSLWRQNLYRGLGFLYDENAKRVFYADGEGDWRTFHIFTIGLDGTNRKEILNGKVAGEAISFGITYAKNRLFTQAYSIDRHEGMVMIRVAAYDPQSGKLLWEKAHDYTLQEFVPVQVPFSGFYPKGDFLVYSSGKDLWIVNAQDGSVYDVYHADQPSVRLFSSRKESKTADQDLIPFVVGANNIAVYRISSKQMVLRTKVPARDPRFTAAGCSTTANTLFCSDGTSVVAFDLAPGIDETKRLKWRLSPENGQRFLGAFMDGDALLAKRAPVGIPGTSEFDSTFLRIDPETGKTIDEFYPLWSPVGFHVDGKRMYVFSEDIAYAMEAK